MADIKAEINQVNLQKCLDILRPHYARESL